MPQAPLPEARERDGRIKEHRTFLSAWPFPSYNWMLKGWFKRGQFAPTRCIDSSVGGTRYKGLSLQMWPALYVLSWAPVLWLHLGSSVWLPSSACVVQPGQWSDIRSVGSGSLWLHGLCSPWDSPGQKTRVASPSLLQGIFPTQGSNPGLPHCRWLLYQLSHKGSPQPG